MQALATGLLKQVEDVFMPMIETMRLGILREHAFEQWDAQNVGELRVP
jgi:hypothetical protein